MVEGETSHLELNKTTLVFRSLDYIDDHKQRRVERIGFLDGTIMYSTFQTDCKVVQVPNRNQKLIEHMCQRFDLSSGKLYVGILPTIKRFKDADYTYFCYKKYDADFFSLNEAGQKTFVALKKACRGFITGLVNLHQAGKVHGNITCYDLVTSDGDGYLGGGFGPSFSDSYMTDRWGVTRLVTDPCKKDMFDLAKALENCFRARDLLKYPADELGMFINYLKNNNTLNPRTFHPYVLVSMEVRGLYVTVEEDFRKMCPVTLNARFKTLRGVRNFKTKGWHRVVESSGDPILLGVFMHPNSDYRDDDRNLVRFCRNIWVHAVKDAKFSAVQHCDYIHTLLEKYFHGFSGLVYEIAHTKQERKIL